VIYKNRNSVSFIITDYLINQTKRHSASKKGELKDEDQATTGQSYRQKT